MLDKLEAIQDRYYYLEERLSDPSLVSDMDQFTKASKEYKDLEEIVQTAKAYQQLLGNIKTAEEMAAEDDAEMREMAKMELDELLPQRAEMEETIKQLLIPKDPEDKKDVIFPCH